MFQKFLVCNHFSTLIKSVVMQVKIKELHLDLQGQNMDLLCEYLYTVSHLFKFR